MAKLTIQQFPQDMSVFPVPRRDFDRCLISGLFQEKVSVNGEERHFLTYIPENQPYDAQCIVIAPPSGLDPVEFLERSGLKEFADEGHLFLHLMQSEGKPWDLTGRDGDFMNYVYARIQSREYYVTMQDDIYAFGIGDGATVAHQATMKFTLEWSGMGSIGSLDEGRILLNAEDGGQAGAGSIALTGEMVIQGGKGQLPVWMAFPKKGKGEQAAIDYWKNQNEVEEEQLSSQFATEIYLPGTVCHYTPINEEKIAQVRVSEGVEDFSMELFREMWKYIGKARRHRGAGKKLLRNFKSAEAYGATRHEIEHAGYTRLWYEYIPPALKDVDRPVPLVVCMHGRGGNAETFLDISGMTTVAEERGFIAVFPQASVYQQKVPDGPRNVLLWEAHSEPREIIMDDLGYIRVLVADVKSRNNIDDGRVYCCGQSSGGAMSATLALYASDIFTASAPWSFVAVPDGKTPVTKEDIPVFIMRGEKDGAKLQTVEGKFPFPLAPNYRQCLEYYIERYELSDEVNTFQSGIYTFYEFRNKKGVPMLTFVNVAGMPHANIPEESWLSYDLFLSKFSRTERGELLYMGRPIR